MNRLAHTDSEGRFLAEFAFECRISVLTVLNATTGDRPRALGIRANQKDVVVPVKYDCFLRHMPTKV